MSRKKQNGRAAGNGSFEHYTKIIRSTSEEVAWRALSSTAQALYPWLKFQWRGADNNNNGKISLSVRQAAASMGVRPDTAAEAFRDLQRKGFLVVTQAAHLGVEGAAKSATYELTELKMPGTEKAQDGRKLYQDWRPGHDYPVKTTGANNPHGNNGKKTKPCHDFRDGPVPKTVTKNGRLS